MRINSDIYFIVNNNEFKRLFKGLFKSNPYNIDTTSFVDNIDIAKTESQNNVYIYSYSGFFHYLRESKLLDTNSIYLFQSLRWDYIKLLFLANGFNVSGGSHSLRHLLTPVELSLARFY